MCICGFPFRCLILLRKTCFDCHTRTHSQPHTKPKMDGRFFMFLSENVAVTIVMWCVCLPVICKSKDSKSLFFHSTNEFSGRNMKIFINFAVPHNVSLDLTVNLRLQFTIEVRKKCVCFFSEFAFDYGKSRPLELYTVQTIGISI